MTMYICQIPVTLAPAKCWEAQTETEVIEACAFHYDRLHDCTDLDEAIRHDQRDAFMSSDLMELYAWVATHEARLTHKMLSAFRRAFEAQVEELAEVGEVFGVPFRWDDEEFEFTLGNNAPAEADDLYTAYCHAWLNAKLARDLESRDV